jgi:hypothetical protein
VMERERRGVKEEAEVCLSHATCPPRPLPWVNLTVEYFGRSTGVTVEGTSTDIYIPHLFGLIRISFFYRFGTGFQWSCVQIISWSNGYVIVKFGLHNIHFGVEVAASSSKYVRSGRKFKIEVYFGWFWMSFRNTTNRCGRSIQKRDLRTDRTDQNSRTGSEQMRNIYFC